LKTWNVGLLALSIARKRLAGRYWQGRGRQTISDQEPKKTEILVLGATGRLGAVLRHHWTGAPGRWQGRCQGAGQGTGQGVGQGGCPGTGFCVFDPLADPGALIGAATGCDAILCLAGVVAERAAAGADIGDNIALAEAAVRAGAAVGARVLLTSSGAVYGARAGLCSEEDTLAPVSDYGRAKAGMEARGADLGARLGVAVTSLRIGNVAGSDAILGGWQPGFALDRFADGRTPRRSYIGPATLAWVLRELAARDDLPGVLNVAAPGVIEMGALLEAAGLGWTPRAAPDSAIPEVGLETTRLTGLVALEPGEATAAAMVAQWRAMTRRGGQ
jgi:nucleoside-diphosphate-sugar epimerase